jgi:D-arabinose 1-dehydrogenase-like Zn-dependent alcohol dehydrogenase
LQIAAKIPVKTRFEVFPLAQANQALHALKHDAIQGAAILWIDS